YADQLERLELAFENGWLIEASVNQIPELELFARLSADNRLGKGECAAIAIAANRDLLIAVDDKRAPKSASALLSDERIIDTARIIVSLIETGALTVGEADAIKELWETECRFRLKFKSFQEWL